MARNWDNHFIEAALLVASMSTCKRRNVGAVAVRDRHQLASGFNGNMSGARHCDEGGCARCANVDVASGDLAGCVCVHAEANLVAWAARVGVSLADSTVYCTTKPCLTCYLLLSMSGVTEVVYGKEYPHELPDGGPELIKIASY